MCSTGLGRGCTFTHDPQFYSTPPAAADLITSTGRGIMNPVSHHRGSSLLIRGAEIRPYSQPDQRE
jgi:hypothetical protein